MQTRSERPAEPPDPPITRTAAEVWLALSVAAVSTGLLVYGRSATWQGPVAVQFGGRAQPWAGVTATADDAGWDFVLIAGYGTALVLTACLARGLFRSTEARRVARAALPLALVTVAADVLENLAHLAAVALGDRRPLDVMTAAAVVKWCCLPMAAAIALTASVVTVSRLWAHTETRLAERRPGVEVLPSDPLDGDPPGRAFRRAQARADGTTPAAAAAAGNGSRADVAVDTGHARWRRGFMVPGIDAEVLRARGPVTGFCLSGGGVRSASVSLGALQSLRTELLGARYLVSVSGGGYTAGALQLALTSQPPPPPQPPDAVAKDPADAYQPGSAEEDRLRRHVRYLAGSPAELLVALGVVARGVLLSLLVLFGPAVVLGVALGIFYGRVPLAWPESADATAPPAIPVGTWWALGLLAATAFAVHASGLVRGLRRYRPPPKRSRSAAIGLTSLSLLVAAVAVGLPWSIHLSARILAESWVGVGVGGPVLGVVLTYVAALASLLRRKKVVEKTKGALGTTRSTIAAVPGGALQLILVVATLAVLAAGWLLLATGFAARATDADAGRLFWGTVAAVTLVLVVLGGVLDQTSLSLHPFYRRRLARTFAARRILRVPDHKVVAERYRYEEGTPLPTYGAKVDGFPHVVFAAAANLTGEQRAPLNAASFTFTDQWLGGPDVGYARTNQVCAAVPPAFRHDLTVQAAVAVSGAAFASAMGRGSRWYSTLLAVSGLRLGTWLPSPAFLDDWHEACENPDYWTRPGLPSIRRITYLFREVLGSHRYQDRLLQITDGGHYENLGLVETLRRRCTEIICIDASGDRPPSAGTLEQAVALAWSELGVRIELVKDVWDLVPGGAPDLEPEGPLAGLNARLSASTVVVGLICYPPVSDLPPELAHGLLVLGKTRLTPDMSYALLSYAARHEVFPHDSTGDQFFTDEMFTAYSALGRHIGAAARDTIAHARRLPETCPACGNDRAREEVLAALRRIELQGATKHRIGGQAELAGRT